MHTRSTTFAREPDDRSAHPGQQGRLKGNQNDAHVLVLEKKGGNGGQTRRRFERRSRVLSAPRHLVLIDAQFDHHIGVPAPHLDATKVLIAIPPRNSGRKPGHRSCRKNCAEFKMPVRIGA